MKKRLLLIGIVSLLSWSIFAKDKSSEEKVEYARLTRLDGPIFSHKNKCNEIYWKNRNEEERIKCIGEVPVVKHYLFERPDNNSTSFGYIMLTPHKGKRGAHLYQWVKPDGVIVDFAIDGRPEHGEGNAFNSHTFIGCSGNWFKLPRNPFPKPLWIKKEFACDSFDRPLSIILKKDIEVKDIESGKKIKFLFAEMKQIRKIEKGQVYFENDLPPYKYPKDNDPEVLKKLKKLTGVKPLKGKELETKLNSIKESINRERYPIYEKESEKIKYVIDIKDFLFEDLHVPYEIVTGD